MEVEVFVRRRGEFCNSAFADVSSGNLKDSVLVLVVGEQIATEVSFWCELWLLACRGDKSGLAESLKVRYGWLGGEKYTVRGSGLAFLGNSIILLAGVD